MAKVKTQRLVDAAVRCGVIEDGPSGRRSYEGWLKRDPDAAVKAVTNAAGAIAREVKREATASGARDYPAHWRGRVKASRANAVRVGDRRAVITQAGA